MRLGMRLWQPGVPAQENQHPSYFLDEYQSGVYQGTRPAKTVAGAVSAKKIFLCRKLSSCPMSRRFGMSKSSPTKRRRLCAFSETSNTRSVTYDSPGRRGCDNGTVPPRSLASAACPCAD